MSTHHNDRPHYNDHQRAAEMHDLAAPTHLAAAEAHEKQDHLTGHGYLHSEPAGCVVPESTPEASSHEHVATMAYALWQLRGCPAGSPEQDWFEATDRVQVQREERL